MNRELQVPLFDLVISLSNAMDLISPDIVNHHKRVAYMAMKIAQQMKLSSVEIDNIVLAAVLHDVGALSYQDRVFARQYEFSNASEHAELGYLLLRNSHRMHEMAELVRYHHVPWNFGEGKRYEDEYVPIGSHIIHLADRVEILINRNNNVLGQINDIVKVIANGNDVMYHPEIVEAFFSLKEKEFFWLDVTSPNIGNILANSTEITSIQLDIDDVLEFTELFSQIIDFRSSSTATHSSGVAVTGEALGMHIGFSERECQMLRVAGNLHDIGKLAIPSEILDKPDKLINQEVQVIRSHTYHTYRILEAVPGLSQINEWASLHHEKLDGTGYPFRHCAKDIPLGSRIIAVADVFTAITEDRPYRSGMERDKVVKILRDMVVEQALDSFVVQILVTHYDEINEVRIQAQSEAYKKYKEFGNKAI